MRISKRLPKNQSRLPLYSATDPNVKHAINKIAAKFDCSRSMVVNTLLGDVLNIHIYDPYRGSGVGESKKS